MLARVILIVLAVASSPLISVTLSAQTTSAVPSASPNIRPNMALRKCAGMDEANYEAIYNALVASGDKDATRTVLCAQAFQYYTMYKRALSQGLSDAGAWPTYETHLQHAKMLQDFDDLANYKPVADSLLGSMVQGAVLGATGADMPAMREDGSAPNALDTLNAANEALARQNADGRAHLDSSIATGSGNAQHQAAGPAGSTIPGGTSGGLARRTVRAYFWVGMRPRETDTRNPVCLSEPFDITIEWDAERGSGNYGRAQAVLQPMVSTFIDKCSRHGTVDGTVIPSTEGIDSGWPWPGAKAGDALVRMN